MAKASAERGAEVRAQTRPVEDDPVIVDALGRRCPAPVVMAKRAMRREHPPQAFHLLVDDEEALHDIPALLARHGWPEARRIDLEHGWRFEITPP